jgi:hypothetical protein
MLRGSQTARRSTRLVVSSWCRADPGRQLCIECSGCSAQDCSKRGKRGRVLCRSAFKLRRIQRRPVICRRLLSRRPLFEEESAVETAQEPPDRPSVGRVTESDIGLVGLGHIGTVMTGNLVTARHRVIGYVRRSDQAGQLVALGVKPASDTCKIFHCDVVVSMLPDDNPVRDVVFGRADLGILGIKVSPRRSCPGQFIFR